ncbi:TetR/AcrR family transcriptional regulator [Lysinibacillus telephonicus]|uniref:TetR/AcrR family transcriptional regulator n=1 Tax=Lysinibacillus telephonicus TaxID=1714840 RepID=A0A3S0JQ76_9BACI|nr:TetR-like C-terminal domain-containing protein [Lysinibacillus telephonicus]RTQ93529.1 TetR/AcrR family transcriptional regulator [Lysinibacillus telephonicus]
MSPRVGLDVKRIIETAAELVDKEGVDSLTLATIARKLNVRPPSLFNHIEGLHSIKRELSLYGLTLFYEKIEEASREKNKNEAIFSFAYAYIQFAREHPGIYELILRAPEPDDYELQAASSRIISLLSSCFSDYNLSEEYKIHAIRALRSILHGFSTLEQKAAFGLPVSIEKTFELMIQGFIDSIK